jgi:alcohol dehydrogenase (cytochrome c)
MTPFITRAAVALAIGFAAMAPVWAQVGFDRILKARSEPQNWLTYSGDTFNQRHSLLTQITRANVKDLELKWVWQAQSLEKFEATALAVNGVLYTVQAPNDLVALDGATGRPFWTYSHSPASNTRTCCGRVNRGVAILGNMLFMGTLDAHLIAVDATSGQLIWNTTVADSADRYSITHAPLVIKDKVLIGTAGGDYGARGLIAAHDVRSRRAGQRDVVRRVVEDRGRRRLEHRRLRSRHQSHVLGHGQSRARLGRAQPPRRQPL